MRKDGNELDINEEYVEGGRREEGGGREEQGE